ncbi:hypothetical protein RHMOL_Rhmol04G0181000 [Rhododendron molle]|uniref:Uncharacterized protein n=1 Tax=Rhododendron molle TaxID=49168 RepID=A0ACC0P1L1_RHOML|nr:hypothetical protein RHMOL_Rhmol04G0181000 [Rhododendron molle]
MPIVPNIPSMAKNNLILPNGFLNRVITVTPTLIIRDGKIIPILHGHNKLWTHIMPHTQSHIFLRLSIRGHTTLLHSKSRITTSLPLHLKTILSIFRGKCCRLLTSLRQIHKCIPNCFTPKLNLSRRLRRTQSE